MFYFKKIVSYFDYYENNEKKKGCGYGKILIRDEEVTLEIHIRGLGREKSHMCDIYTSQDRERSLGRFALDKGTGYYHACFHSRDMDGSGLTIFDINGLHISVGENKYCKTSWEWGELPISIVVNKKEPAGGVPEPGERAIEAQAPEERASEASESGKRVSEVPEPGERAAWTPEPGEASSEASESGKRVSEVPESEGRAAWTPEPGEALSEASESGERAAWMPEPERTGKETPQLIESREKVPQPDKSTEKAWTPELREIRKEERVPERSMREEPSQETYMQDMPHREGMPAEVPEGQEAVNERAESEIPGNKSPIRGEFAGGKRNMYGQPAEMEPEEERPLYKVQIQSMSDRKEGSKGKEAAPVQSPLYADKWKQLCSQYPVCHPFEDGEEYITIAPKDFVILRKEYQNLVSNSFLLHSFYNYHHVILGKAGKENNDMYYIGVPGNYLDREKRVAVMFGFEGFAMSSRGNRRRGGQRKERMPVEAGAFGYYMRKVEI